jgi:hypothetical protein
LPLASSGGTFSGASAQALLRGLVAACPELEELRLLPAPRCGLGDADMPMLVELKHLKVGCTWLHHVHNVKQSPTWGNIGAGMGQCKCPRSSPASAFNMLTILLAAPLAAAPRCWRSKPTA